ncbi:unnamed protein product [Adineta ricciae]|uniref:Uncharacterized protein n=1 Tax=Adineta ricciae TaxID=249248 RepID=A0A816FYI4_ADIRI|nr:unnamed protein product [Adineta ricciae]CAF1667415.1 unnamed protein product [Adineta ricciae]
MKQYPESYCFTLMEPTDGRIVAIAAVNLKKVQFGFYLMNVAFARLGRVDPNQRRKYLLTTLFSHMSQWRSVRHIDYSQGYTSVTNLPSLSFQRRSLGAEPEAGIVLNSFILPTGLISDSIKLQKLTSEETERLWMIDMIDWTQRPVLSDLRHIMQLNDYVGTFIVGDFASQQFAAAMIWQPSSTVLCDDRLDVNNPYRGQTQSSVSIDIQERFLSALSSMMDADGIPFFLCDVQESSPFKSLLQRRALAATAQFVSRTLISQRMTDVVDHFVNSPIWFDPRDFGALLYFKALPDQISSQL